MIWKLAAIYSPPLSLQWLAALIPSRCRFLASLQPVPLGPGGLQGWTALGEAGWDAERSSNISGPHRRPALAGDGAPHDPTDLRGARDNFAVLQNWGILQHWGGAKHQQCVCIWVWGLLTPWGVTRDAQGAQAWISKQQHFLLRRFLRTILPLPAPSWWRLKISLHSSSPSQAAPGPACGGGCLAELVPAGGGKGVRCGAGGCPPALPHSCWPDPAPLV